VFELSVRETAGQRLSRWLPAAVGLLAAGGVAWLARPRLAADSLSWLGVAALAVGYVLLCAGTGIAVAAACWAMLPRTESRRRFDLRVVAAMVWLAPLALFLSQRSVMWAALASVVAGWTVVRSQRSPRSEGDRKETWRVGELPSPVALAAALCFQGGLVAAALDRGFAAAGLLAAGSALVAWAYSINSSRDSPRAPLGLQVLRAFVFALLLTVGGLTAYLRGGADGERWFGAPRVSDAATEPAGALGGMYRGVILVPEPGPHKIVAPPAAALKHEASTARRKDPFTIPFFGVYWMFRFPFSEPPPGSYVSRGSPLKSVFRSSDRFPLAEEARQNFGTPIELSCCRQIQLAVRSADLHSRFISLELILKDTTLPGSLSLGQRVLVQEGDWRPDARALPVEEILSFEVPGGARISKFDEATIRFHARFPFVMASAKVAIDRFVFVP
jgi:hypothetical protein